MAEQIVERINSGFVPVRIHIGTGKSLSVGRQNIAPDHPFREILLPLIIWIIYYLTGLRHLKINKISQQYEEQARKYIGDPQDLPVNPDFFWAFFFPARFPFPGTLFHGTLFPGILFLLFFVHLLLPHFCRSYADPEGSQK